MLGLDLCQQLIHVLRVGVQEVSRTLDNGTWKAHSAGDRQCMGAADPAGLHAKGRLPIGEDCAHELHLRVIR